MAESKNDDDLKCLKGLSRGGLSVKFDGSVEQIKVSALLRIADAQETLAGNMSSIHNEKEYWRGLHTEMLKECTRLRMVIGGHK